MVVQSGAGLASGVSGASIAASDRLGLSRGIASLRSCFDCVGVGRMRRGRTRMIIDLAHAAQALLDTRRTRRWLDDLRGTAALGG
jgi:hypothetical protein